jgi:hypothetical protein
MGGRVGDIGYWVFWEDVGDDRGMGGVLIMLVSVDCGIEMVFGGL